MTDTLAAIEQWDCANAMPDLGQVFQRTRPLVLRSLVADWPMVRAARQGDTALADYLSARATNEPVTVYEGSAGAQSRVFYNEDMSGFNFTPSQAPLQEVLSQLVRDSAPQSVMRYVGSTLIDRWLPTLSQDNPMSEVPEHALRSIWLGNQATIPAHFDFPDNLACVVAGRRRFTLFPPDQVANLYVGPLERTPAGQPISLVDMDNPDFERFPRFQEALSHAQAAELKTGDALFIPSMWWHHVASLDTLNVLINYWWRSSPHYLGNPTNALFHALLSIGQLPPAQKKAWQSLFEHWVFNNDETRLSHLPEDKRGALGDIDLSTARRLRADLINKLNR